MDLHLKNRVKNEIEKKNSREQREIAAENRIV
jgi:hypothetical protein